MPLDLGEDSFNHIHDDAVPELLIALDQRNISCVHIHAVESHGPSAFSGGQLADPAIDVIGTGFGGGTASVGGEGDGVAVRGVDALSLSAFTHDANTERLGGFWQVALAVLEVISLEGQLGQELLIDLGVRLDILVKVARFELLSFVQLPEKIQPLCPLELIGYKVVTDRDQVDSFALSRGTEITRIKNGM